MKQSQPVRQFAGRRRQLFKTPQEDGTNAFGDLQFSQILFGKSPSAEFAAQEFLFDQVLQHLLEEERIPADAFKDPFSESRFQPAVTRHSLNQLFNAFLFQGLQRKDSPLAPDGSPNRSLFP